MSVYRRLARSKKGMSTIFGGLFFVIIILMGFNVMLWGFIQYDAYNHVITSMSQRDRIINPSPALGTYFTNGNIPAGAVNFVIHVVGINVKDGNSYRISLATTRGRLFSMYFPWRFSSLIVTGGGGGNFVTTIGPLAVYFDFKSFNYTSGTQTLSQSAFCLPNATPVVLYIRLANTATDGNVTLLSRTGIEAQAYGVNGFGQFSSAWILAPNSINPSTNFAYNPAAGYNLQAAGPNGPTPASFAVVKIGGAGPNQPGAVTFSNAGASWITFIGFTYLYKNQVQGETIPFMDFVTNAPNCNN